jgi:hypothetical protein
MTYDKPAQVVWVANLTATGYVNSTFLKIVDNTSPIINIVDKYTDTGYLNSSLSNYFLNTKILYTITDNNFNENLSSLRFIKFF